MKKSIALSKSCRKIASTNYTNKMNNTKKKIGFKIVFEHHLKGIEPFLQETGCIYETYELASKVAINTVTDSSTVIVKFIVAIPITETTIYQKDYTLES